MKQELMTKRPRKSIDKHSGRQADSVDAHDIGLQASVRGWTLTSGVKDSLDHASMARAALLPVAMR